MNKLGLLCRRCHQRLTQARYLNLQEFQSKQLLRQNGCTVQNFFIARNEAEAKEHFSKHNFDEYVVKAQILAGGRGKGTFIGASKDLKGVSITRSQEHALKNLSLMLNKRLVTKQTSKEGVTVKTVMVAESVEILRETYLAILLDRNANGPIVVASPAGGTDIEEVAEKNPELILQEPICIETGVTDAQAMKIAKFLQFPESVLTLAAKEIQRLYELLLKIDATQVEINPFAETSGDKVYCIDAKINFDDSAAFRQKEIFALESGEEQDAREVEAHKYHLNYIGLDGDIACLVNGAGLAMATMDIIKLNGGEPANFLDVGGTVTEDQVYHAFRILTMDSSVKAILVNIFGGIVNCATIARGLIKAFERMQLEVPLIVRLEGTNVDEARRLLNESHLPIMTAHHLDEAGKMAVEAAKYKSSSKVGEEELKSANHQQ
ncbi:ATP-grasp domain-containing protein [Ditylenchus destructor]|uniref:Succinate--CoA ligase [GDP-forming] subunit beta, mitochondrial n=1 Tax=Ditylenchus destructor TaxID=166010 RepID=A0AAD4QZB6_9BILA|nr:ATP-grasp domain-containing protein [Ditylenchus destructor]